MAGLSLVCGLRSCGSALRCGAARSCALRGSGRRLLSTAAAEAAPAAEAEATGLRWLLKEGQVDSGFWQGSALLAATLGAVTFTSEEQRKTACASLLQAYRSAGLEKKYIGDKQLVEDYVKKYSVAALNVLMASPVFYFSFARVYSQPLSVCCVRGLTGSLRIVPFMFGFYGFFAVASPFAAQMLMRGGTPYAKARDDGAMYIFPPLIFVESIVELRGCGVTFAQMTPSSFIIFIPALVGRLLTGIVTQTNKVGQEESVKLLPDSWNTQDAPTWQQHTYLLFDKLALDKEFVVTCAVRTATHTLHLTHAPPYTRSNSSRASPLRVLHPAPPSRLLPPLTPPLTPRLTPRLEPARVHRVPPSSSTSSTPSRSCSSPTESRRRSVRLAASWPLASTVRSSRVSPSSARLSSCA